MVEAVAQGTSDDAATRAHEQHRGELLAHCYRLLGSYDDAEDVVQETLLRAWKAAGTFDPGRGSLRTWLHAIATNACLTAVNGRSRRPLPSGLGAAGTDPMAPLTPSLDIPWLQPFPGDGPEGEVLQRSGLRLGFVAALQLLPARQRAALLLREVVALSAAEAADVLGTSVASVNSSLQRARATLRAAGPDLDTLREPDDAADRAVVEAYAAAFEAADMPALIRLIADDVILEMPPVDLWLQGSGHYAAFLDRVFAMRGTRWRLVPVRANGSAALAAFVADPAGSLNGFRAHSLQQFEVHDGRVRRCVTFADPAVVSRFEDQWSSAAASWGVRP